MTTDQQPGCKCKHSLAQHKLPSLAPQCSAPGCTCLKYRDDGAAKLAQPAVTFTPPTPETRAAVAAVAPPATVTTPPPGLLVIDERPTVEQLLTAGARSTNKRIANLASKIDDLVAGLREQLRHETETAAARQEIADLEAKLAAARNKIRKPAKPKKPSAPKVGPHQCPECPDSFTAAHGLTMHRIRKHGYRKNPAAS